ncbi:Uncharacterised protein [Mycobacteroides abscessus subsp. massiliense]|nr:Uncharacterised protein [Mycobacteroides abscessus subsp. massiliense]
MADVDRALDTRDHGAGRGDCHIDAPVRAEQRLIADVIDAGHDPGHTELGLGQQAHDQICLVVTGGGDNHVTGLDPCFFESLQLAGIGVEPVGPGHRVRIEVAALAFDQQDLVAVVEQLAGNGTADLAGAGNSDSHLPFHHPAIVPY